MKSNGDVLKHNLTKFCHSEGTFLFDQAFELRKKQFVINEI
jgi:hypothetical protein